MSVKMTLKAWIMYFSSIFVDLDDWIFSFCNAVDLTVRNFITQHESALCQNNTDNTQTNAPSQSTSLRTPVYPNILFYANYKYSYNVKDSLFMSASALAYMCVSGYTLAGGRTLSPSRFVTNYLIKFHWIKATFENLAESQAHCSPANEIKETFAFLPAFNYISGRTARAQRLNEERGKVKYKRSIHCTVDSFLN